MLRRMSRAGAIAVAIVGLARGTVPAQDPGPSSAPAPLGFSPNRRASQTEAETRALAVPTPAHARSWLKTLTEEPHVAGTPADYKTALFVRDRLRDWGWDAELAEYEVLLNYPEPPDHPSIPTTLEIVRPEPQKLPVTESPVPGDKDAVSPAAFAAFHGYGASGRASGQVVYANYGRPEDFDALKRLGVDVRGKIVLIRYGELFRGLKVLNAQKRGAVGVLIYSDPADDGYAKGDVYPTGPFRPGSAIQRGSVQFLSLGPGDPSTPHGPSIKGAERLPIDRRNGFPLNVEPNDPQEAPNAKERTAGDDWEKQTGLVRNDYFASIPALPISYDAARPILSGLAGDNVPAGWQGGLPMAYHVGPGPVEVKFSTFMDYKIRPIWNVIAKLKGEVEPDRWVMVGNHRDAWVYGAVDPGSGTASTLEMCRALGAAVKHGWKPKRTIVYASWDAEEYGLVGSTEWAEEHAKTLNEKAVLLLNVDSAVAGAELDVDGVPSLRDLLLDAAGAVTDVRTGQTLRKSWLDRRRARWVGQTPVDLAPLSGGADAAPEETAPAPRFSPQMNPLGSGSDYTAFLDHLGIPALDVGFSGRYGVYHSIYDDFHWMETQGDPEFLTHAQAARFYTVLVMRAAAADVVPLTFTPYAEALAESLNDLRRMVERKARGSGDSNKPPFRFQGVGRLSQSIAQFAAQAQTLDRRTAALAAESDVSTERLSRCNDALSRVERAFLLKDGLPGRRWFKHAIYAPGLTTGYASWPLPGVRQAITNSDSEMLAAQVAALAERIDAATAALKEAEAAAQP